MAQQDLAKFFADVYDDKGLQGTLHAALVKAAPEVVVAVGKAKGYEFSEADLASTVTPPDLDESELSDQDLAAVSGGASIAGLTLGLSAMQFNFWGSFSAFKDIGTQAFSLGIPGPTFVQVMNDDENVDDQDCVDEEMGVKPSATELYASLSS